jgi:ABC-type uncharacterized transport system permease subunit
MGFRSAFLVSFVQECLVVENCITGIAVLALNLGVNPLRTEVYFCRQNQKNKQKMKFLDANETL